jgi:exodeoxyribonuclease VII large subunit
MSSKQLSLLEEAVRASKLEQEEKVFSIAELNRSVRVLLEDRWAGVWVIGELSDVTRATSGHLYFTVNDEHEPAQIRAVMFRSDVNRTKTVLEDGARVRLRGTLSLFEPRGSYQLIVRVAVSDGQGDLQAQFERLRKKLQAEGLFAQERKRKLPLFPRVIGVVTSLAGAALHDIIRVAQGRCPVRIVVSPCTVQGAEAPASIVAALEAIQRLPDLDLVIVGRGGGSAEDLFAFNDERVARAIAACRVHTISAVGHEVDVTIADLVADARAATPSNAAEIALPESAGLNEVLQAHRRALERSLEVAIARHRLQLDRLSALLRDPREALGAIHRKLQELSKQTSHSFQRGLRQKRSDLHNLSLRLMRVNPRVETARRRAELSDLTHTIRSAGQPLVNSRRAELGELSARLHALSPLSILARGYAIVRSESSGRALLDADQVSAGDRISIWLHQGQLRARVE